RDGKQRAVRQKDCDEEDESAKAEERPAPRSQRQTLRPRAFSREGDEGAPSEISALERERRHGQRNKDQRQRRGEPILRRVVEERVDARRQGKNPRRQADDSLRAE